METNNSKVLIVGDVHLGKGLSSLGRPGIGTNLNSRLVDQIKLLDWIFEKSLEHQVTSIIFTGDIFEDVKPDYSLVKIFFSFLGKCANGEIEVHIVAGNHDLKRSGANYTSVLDLVDLQDSEYLHFHKHLNTLHFDGLSITLLPFRDRKSLSCETHDQALIELEERLPYELSEIPSNHDKVLIGHLALEGAIYVGDEVDDQANELMCPLSLFAGYDYVWMGHVHKPQVHSKSPYRAHIGSLDLSDFGESDHQKILILFDPNLKSKFIEIPVPSRPLKKIVISIPKDGDATALVQEELEKINKATPLDEAIVRLEVKLEGLESKNVNRKVIEELCGNLKVSYLCGFLESRNVSVVPTAKQSQIVDNTISPKAAIKHWSQEHNFELPQERESYLAAAHATLEKLQGK